MSTSCKATQWLLHLQHSQLSAPASPVLMLYMLYIQRNNGLLLRHCHAVVQSRCCCFTLCRMYLQTALDAVAPGGKIVLVGLGAEKCCIPTMQTVFKELDFLGSFRYTNTVSKSKLSPLLLHVMAMLLSITTALLTLHC